MSHKGASAELMKQRHRQLVQMRFKTPDEWRELDILDAAVKETASKVGTGYASAGRDVARSRRR
jgi:hypothetical protein